MGKRTKRAENSAKTARRGNPDKIQPYRWQKGCASPNPGGRPRTAILSQAVRQKLADLVPGDSEGRTYAQKIADSLIERAARGDAESFRALGDRSEGKAPQSIALTSTAPDLSFDGWNRTELRRFAETGEMPERLKGDEADRNET